MSYKSLGCSLFAGRGGLWMPKDTPWVSPSTLSYYMYVVAETPARSVYVPVVSIDWRRPLPPFGEG